MAVLTVQNPSSTGGAALTMAAAAGGGDEFANNGKVALLVTNGGGASITVTLDAAGTCSFGLAANAAHDLAFTVAAGATKMVGPLDMSKFNAADGNVDVTYSAVTSVTVAAVRIQ